MQNRLFWETLQKTFYPQVPIVTHAVRGIPKMLPRHIPTLEGSDAERFAEQDKKPLTTAEKAHLEKCRAVYKKNPIK